MFRSPGFVLAAVISVSLALVVVLVQLQQEPTPEFDNPRAAMQRPTAHVSHQTLVEAAADST